jgi:DHA3 family tetracycline resistance protein-like MFS transporter
LSTRPTEPSEKPAGILGDLREGIKGVLGSPWIWITITISALANLTQSAPFSVVLPFLVSNTLHADVKVLGWIYSSYYFGSVIAAILLGSAAKLRKRGLTSYVCIIASGLTTLSLGLPIPLLVILVGVLIRGFSFTAFELIWTNTLQELVPRQLLGRVASVDYLGAFALLPIGYGLAGWAADVIGPPLVFVVGGAITTVVAVLGMSHPVVRKVD